MGDNKIEIDFFIVVLAVAFLLFGSFGKTEFTLYDAIMLKLAPDHYVVKGTPDAKD